jgi:hypothetical protein
LRGARGDRLAGFETPRGPQLTPNAGLAELLTIEESTAKTHVKRILGTIGACDRAMAYQGGLMKSR